MTIYHSKQGLGEPLVLFHGWGYDSRIWSALLPALEQEFELHCIDLPGFGQSKLQDWEGFKAQVLERLPQRFNLLGWSLGGLFATRLALEAPYRIASLINVGSSPFFLEDKGWPGVSEVVFEGFYQRMKTNPKKVLREFSSLQARGCELPNVGDDLVASSSLQFGLDVLRSWDLRESLKTITIPVSYVFGRLDAIVPVNLLLTMQAIYPEFDYQLFKKAAHMPFLSDQKAFIDFIRARLL